MNIDFSNRLREAGIKLDRSGKQTCPQCSASRTNKTDKCLSVSYESDAVLYYCHHCGWTGAIPYEENKYKRKYNRPTAYKSKDDKKPLINYFKKRGISEQTLIKYNIGINDDNEIIFPYYKNGILVNVKTRKNLGEGKKTFTQTKESEKTFFGMDMVKGEKELIVVEGEMDVLALAEQGIYAVSVPQGGSDSKLECLANCSNEFLKSFESYVIAVDNDTVGIGLRDRLLERFPKDKCKIVNWGEFKDANEVLMAGKDLHEYINGAKYVQTEGIYTFDDSNTFDELYMELFNDKETDVYKTGWTNFDELLKIKTGYLMVVTGYPSRGKSYFVKNMLMNLSKRYDMKHLVASFEDTKGSLYTSLYEMYTKKTIFKTKYEEGKNALTKILGGDEYGFITEHFYGFENDRQWDIDSIIDRTEIEYIKHGIKTLVIDPYNRLKNDYTEREDKYIGSILSKLCMLAKKLNILVIFIAHPKKPEKGMEMSPPTMYSISGSGDWYNMADYGIVVHRNRTETGTLEDFVKVDIQKVKNFSLGEPKGGNITLKFNKITRNIENMVAEF
jgi:twinkle protein